MIDWELLKPFKSESDIEAESARQEAILYLRSTDWYVIRNIETGQEVPVSISELRAQARSKL
jgi:hypothetical protein